MKTNYFLLPFLLLCQATIAQCYSTVTSFQRNYIALQTDGTLWAKGDNFYGSLGFETDDPVLSFRQLGTDTDWTENISFNGSFGLAIKTNGTLWAWGNSFSNGATGMGTFEDQVLLPLTQVGTDANWAKVSSGGSTTIGVKTDGTLWVWGTNDRGRLGIGNPDDLYKVNLPIQLGTDTDWQNAFTGIYTKTMYAIKTDGTLWAWGNNGINLGYPNSTVNNAYRTPHQVGTDSWSLIVPGTNALSNITFGIKTNGTLWAWGNSGNSSYFFGNGIDVYTSPFPEQIGTANDWAHLVVSQKTVQALKTNGTRWGWGWNTSIYQLGMGAGFTSLVTVPTQLDAATDWSKIAIDLDEGCGIGIKQDNTLYYWGANNLNVISPSPALLSASPCTLGVTDYDKNSFVLFPNPVQAVATVQLQEPTDGNTILLLTNNLGQTLSEQKIPQGQLDYSVPMIQYPQGVYYITLQREGKQVTTKLIKQ